MIFAYKHVELRTWLCGCILLKKGCDVFLFQINKILNKIRAHSGKASYLVRSTFEQFQNILDEREKNKELRVLADSMVKC